MEEDDIHQISVRVPTPATQKDLARAILQALEFPVARDSTASRMWELVIHHLRLRKCQLIHLYEAQELGGPGSDGEKAAVINSLKSLMQIRNWPVILLLSGTPDLDQLIAQDPQLLRRFSIVRFLPMTEFHFREHVASLIAGYTGHAGMMQAAELRDAEFVPRLLHAGREQLGIVIELTIGAFSKPFSLVGKSCDKPILRSSTPAGLDARSRKTRLSWQISGAFKTATLD